MYYTLSRTAALTPYLTVHARSTPYAPGEIAPLGGNFEHLRGDFCGAASLKLSAPPGFQAGDWVQVYLDGDPDDDPTYLGEAEGEPWEAGAGELKCRPLSVTVGKSKWRGKATAGFRDYLTAAFIAAGPKGITLGSIPDVVATLKSNTLFEEFGDTLAQALPVASATAGVNSHAVWNVYQYSGEITHRFVLGEAQTPPGGSGDYANCVRFGYKRPDSVDTYFEGRVQTEVDVRGELWESAGLPTNVTTTAFNPYAGTTVDINIPVVHPDDPTFNLNLHTTNTALTPTWSGHLGDGLGIGSPILKVNSGADLPLSGLFYQGVRITKDAGSTSVNVYVPSIPSVVPPGGGTRLYVRIDFRSDGGAWQTSAPDQGGGTSFVASGLVTEAVYNGADLQAYFQAGGAPVRAFNLQVTNPPPSLKVFMPAATAASSTGGLRATGQLLATPVDITLPGSVNGTVYNYVVRDLAAPTSARVALPGVFTWRAGDLVTTDVNVTGAVLQDLGATPVVNVTLTRKDDIDGPDPAHPEIGRRRSWATPADVVASTVVVTGDPNQVGWIGAAIADQSALIAYAYGLLRYRIQPVRQWVGLIRTLKRVPCRGVANFEVAGGDVGLDVQRCVYDLTAGTVTVEAGTPVARSDAAAVVGRIESLQRQIRTLGAN